jgi:hypothetical protein
MRRSRGRPHHHQRSAGYVLGKKSVRLNLSSGFDAVRTTIIIILIINCLHRDAAFLHVSVNKIGLLEIFSVIVGWTYFAAWSISFYPQIYINYTRKR